MDKFKNLGLSEQSVSALKQKGFVKPTIIQEKTIPVLLKTDGNIIAQAQTGTGKTAAFGLVFIEKLLGGQKIPQALVLVPTRELALQVTNEINSLKGNKKINVIPVYGGQSITVQLKQLRDGADVVVGTPGRIIDHLRQKSLKINNLKYLVLDEADEMLNMGFIEDIEKIFAYSNQDKQLLLFSATMPDRIIKLVKKFIPQYELIRAEKENITTDLIDQIYYTVKENHKFEALCRVIEAEDEFYGIVFCRTKINTDTLTRHLMEKGYKAEALHGDIVQSKRERILQSFKRKEIKILVATDVAARGIDVNNLSHIVNYSIPENPETYVHRIGRTGRAGKKGRAITLISSKDHKNLSLIKKEMKMNIRHEKIPDISDIMNNKKIKFAEKIKEMISGNDMDYFREMAKTLFGQDDKNDIIAAFLKYSFADQLNYGSNADINESKEEIRDDRRSGRRDHKGSDQTRLFITLGKRDDLTVKTLVKLIEDASGVEKNNINMVDVFDSYSFVSVSPDDCELIIDAFKNYNSDRKIVVQIADRKNGKNNNFKKQGFKKSNFKKTKFKKKIYA